MRSLVITWLARLAKHTTFSIKINILIYLKVIYYTQKFDHLSNKEKKIYIKNKM